MLIIKTSVSVVFVDKDEGYLVGFTFGLDVSLKDGPESRFWPSPPFPKEIFHRQVGCFMTKIVTR